MAVSILISCNNSRSKEPSKTGPLLKKSAILMEIETIDENNFIVFDEVLFLTGAEAEKAYKEDNSNESFSDLYYIRNTETTEQSLEVSDTVRIFMKTFSYNSHGEFEIDGEIDFSIFEKIFSDAEYAHYKMIPFKLEILGEQVIRIEEIYIP